MRSIRGFRTFLAVAMVITLLAAGCTGKGAAPSSTPAPSSKEPIKLGVVVPLSTNTSLYGKQQLGAVKLAVKELNEAGGINGRQVELVVEDSANSNTVAISALTKVLAQRPVALIGPVIGTQMLAMVPVIDKDEIPTITLSGTRKVTEQGSKNVFRPSIFDGITKVATTKYMLDEMKKTKIGLIVVAEEWGYSARDIITAVLKDRGLKPVGVETYQASDKDMSAQLLNLKKAGAEVIVIQGYLADTALILKQARQLNLRIPLVSSPDAQAAAGTDITEGADVDGLIVQGLIVPTQSEDSKIQSWTKAFEQLNQYKPDQYALLQYDSVRMLFEVMKKYGVDREAIRKGLKEITYQGQVYSFHSDPKGNMIDSAIILQYDNQKRAKVVKVIKVAPEEQK